jgi:hypothetical protein
MIWAPIMHQPATCTSWKIICDSSDEARALHQWLSSRIDLERVMTDTVRVTPDGVEQMQTVRHRLGDYFAPAAVATRPPRLTLGGNMPS